jgi:uncharacterized protein
MVTLDLPTARAFILKSQMLSSDANLSGKAGVRKAIEHLGYVQIDTISVVKRAHHHVLWTRVKDYAPQHLQELEENDRAVFDYWAHAASYLPMRDYRFSLIRKKETGDGSGFWTKNIPEVAGMILGRLREEGPLMSKDFDKNGRPDMPWKLPEVNQVLRWLFLKGEIMIVARRGFQKVFDFPERVLPADTDTGLPFMQEYVIHLIRRDLRAQGLLKLREFGYLLKIPQKDWQAALDKMLKSGEVEEVHIEGLGKEPYFAFAGQAGSFSPPAEKQFHILSPFDNLVIQRKRLEELFGFTYTLECYVPEPKRKFGYFGLPLLHGTNFVGLADLKADRKTGILWVKKVAWEGKPSAKTKAAFEKKLQAFARFCGCGEVRVRN